MKIQSIEASDVLPIKEFHVSGLSEVVVLAGPNGVGKTRLLEGILRTFQSQGYYGGPNPNVRLVITATSNTERTDWGKDTLDTALP